MTIMTEMSKKEIRAFLMQGTLTGKLATVKKDGSPHLVPIWFILDDNNDKSNIIFTTSVTSVKAKISSLITGCVSVSMTKYRRFHL